MSTDIPPHLRLSLPLPAQSFKRSFQQFGLDIDSDSPGGSADDGLGTSASAGTSRSALGSQSGSGGSNGNRNGVDMGREYGGERNKRARSEGPGGGGVDGDVSGSGGGVDTSSGSISSFVVGSSGSSANVSHSSQTRAGSSSSYMLPVPWETSSAGSDNASMPTTTVASPSIDPVPIGPIFGSGVPGLGLNHDAPTSARSNARSDTYVDFRSPADLEFLHSLERYTEFEGNIAPLRPTPSPEGISSQASATSAWSSRAAADTSGATGRYITTASTHGAPTRVGRERTRRRPSGGLLAFLRPSRPTSPISEMEEVGMVPPRRRDVSNLRVDLGDYFDRATRETDAQRTFADGPPMANTSRHSLALDESSPPNSHTAGWRFHSPEPRSAGSSQSSEQPLSFPWDEDSYSDMLRRLENDISETEQDALDTDSEPSFMSSPSNVSRRLEGTATLRRDTRDLQSSSHGAADDGSLDLPSMQDLYGDILSNMHIPTIPSQLNGSGRSAWRIATDPQATGMREAGNSSNESRIPRDDHTRYGLGRSTTLSATPSRLRAPGRLSRSFDLASPRGEQARNDFASASSPSTPSSNRPRLPTLRSAVEMEAMRSAATGQSTRLGSMDRLDDGFLVDREDDDDRLSRLGNPFNRPYTRFTRERVDRANQLGFAPDRRSYPPFSQVPPSNPRRRPDSSHSMPSLPNAGNHEVSGETLREHRRLRLLSYLNDGTNRGPSTEIPDQWNDRLVASEIGLSASRELPRISDLPSMRSGISRQQVRATVTRSIPATVATVRDMEERLQRIPPAVPMHPSPMWNRTSSPNPLYTVHSSSEAAAFFASEETHQRPPERLTTHVRSPASNPPSLTPLQERMLRLNNLYRNAMTLPRPRPRPLSYLSRDAGNTPYSYSIPLAENQDEFDFASEARMSPEGHSSLDNLEQWMRHPSFAPFSHDSPVSDRFEHAAGAGLSAARQRMGSAQPLGFDTRREASFTLPSPESLLGRRTEHGNTRGDVPLAQVGELYSGIFPGSSASSSFGGGRTVSGHWSRQDSTRPVAGGIPEESFDDNTDDHDRLRTFLRSSAIGGISRQRRELHSVVNRRFRPSQTSSVNGQNSYNGVSQDFDRAINILQGDGLSEGTQRRLQEAFAEGRERAVGMGHETSSVATDTRSNSGNGLNLDFHRRRAEEHARTIHRRRERPNSHTAFNSQVGLFPNGSLAAPPPSSTNPSTTNSGTSSPSDLSALFAPPPVERRSESRRRTRWARLHQQQSDRDSFSFASLFGSRLGRRNPGDFMRDEDFDSSYEGLLALAATLGEAKSRATPADVIAALPSALYKDWQTPDSDQRCPICLDDYQPTDPVLKAQPCSHWCHKECLEQWLHSARTCPVCRTKINKSRRANAFSSTSAARTGPSSASAPVAGPSRHTMNNDADTDDDSDTSMHLNPYSLL